MGKFERAKEVNRAACKICTDTKDLESQYEKFQKGIKEIMGGVVRHLKESSRKPPPR